MGDRNRADAPVAKVDFVNLVVGMNPDATAPQPMNHALVDQGAISIDGSVLVNTRALVDEALRDPALYSSADLVEQGNTLPLIPLNIDPPDHVKYRKLLDPLFAPRRIDALDADITVRVNRFIDTFVDRGSCNFTAEFAELFPASVFLGMMGLPWEELDTLIELRDGLLRPGTREMQPEERSAIQRATAQRVYAYFGAILDERAAAPRDDILSLFVAAEADGERLTRDEVLVHLLRAAHRRASTPSPTRSRASSRSSPGIPTIGAASSTTPASSPTRSRSSCAGRRRCPRSCGGRARTPRSAARRSRRGTT